MTDSQRSTAMADAADCALLMIDFMPKLMLGCTTLDPQILLGNAVALAEIGTMFDMPTLTTGGRPDDPWLRPVLDAIGPRRRHVDRETVDCFETAAFVEAVEATGRRTLVMAGITTDLCVLLPALSARARGYQVQVVVDASGCFTPQVETVALMRLQQAGVQLTTWAAFAAELHRASNWQEGVGPKIMQSFGKHHGGIGLIAAMPGERE